MKVFVYGTLLRGHPNHVLLDGATFIGKGSIPGELYHLGSYPGVKLKGSDPVFGEVYEISESMLERLDRLEGYTPGRQATFYDRKKVMVTTLKSDRVIGSTEAMVFEYVPDVQTNFRIPSGDWNEKPTFSELARAGDN